MVDTRLSIVNLMKQSVHPIRRQSAREESPLKPVSPGWTALAAAPGM